MSSGSERSAGKNRRINSLQKTAQLQRNGSYTKRRTVSPEDAYLWALRVAYLAYLLQPRAKRLQHVAAPKPIHKSSTSVADLVKDFSLVRDSKSTRFPHGFMDELDKRLTRVLYGQEKAPEFNDAQVKRTFAVFLNVFKETKFRKSMEKDRRVEDLLLIFFSNATKELSRGKDDDSWKLMVDRHVALFVRLIRSTLSSHDWQRDRPELSSRLETMERKLLIHDQDLSANGASGGTTIEVEVPRSYELKDMPLALVVQRIFGIPYAQVQADITNCKDMWTEKAALFDLKLYQTNLNLSNKKTLNSEDFDTDEAYQAWKKGEGSDLSQMILAIIQSSPELAKSTSGAGLPQFKPGSSNASDSGYSDMSRKMSDNSEGVSSYVIDQPVDMSALSLNDLNGTNGHDDTDAPYTFIPPEPRAFYRAVLKQALEYDLKDPDLQPTEPMSETQSLKLFSKQSAELLNEIALRWRIPQFSRITLFMDVICEKYENQEIDLDTLDAAFTYVKALPLDAKKGGRTSIIHQSSLLDRSKWTVADYALNQKILATLHDALLRDLFELMLLIYDKKPPPLGPVMYILTNHIYEDPICPKTPEDLDEFSNQLKEALRHRAADIYREMLAKEIPLAKEEWEFYHVIQLGKSVVGTAQKIQKRYRKNPEVMGVNAFQVLVEEIFPSYAADARDIILRIIEVVHERGEEVGIQDGFDLYRELVEIRKVHGEALPGHPFAFHIEEQLQDFVWRWIQATDENLVQWVENAVKQDNFQVRTQQPNQIPSEDERYSLSIADIFRSFNQSIEQIVQLNWDDDLQYAKFMTALSKTIGNGLGRYCELVEMRFAKEMDRMTPEQEAAARQSRQEKWMQLAKDAFASKEKIEPFQFLPEVRTQDYNAVSTC